VTRVVGYMFLVDVVKSKLGCCRILMFMFQDFFMIPIF
jgi:hypothetical protein